MAEKTTGLVQRLSITAGNIGLACAWIGPTPTNTELLFILRDNSDPADVGTFKNSIVDALVTAQVGRREVVATHGDSDAEIFNLNIEPT